MANPPILKTHCSVAYTTPSLTVLNLPINCANSNTVEWPWTYFRTTTTGLEPPVTEGGFQQSDPFFSVSSTNNQGQTVIRGIFAYIATDPMTLNINMQSSFYLSEENESMVTRFIAKLYDPSGDAIETYKDITSTTYFQQTQVTDAVLPATVCPKILWVGVAIQPDSDSPPPIDCSASMEVSVT